MALFARRNLQRIRHSCGLFTLGLAALAGAAGCGDDGSYELSWTLGCEQRGAAACEVRSARDCAAAGLDTIAVEAVGRGALSLFPCYSRRDGALGRGPGLAEGPLELAVSGRNAAGQTLSGPVAVSLVVPAEGLASVTVDLPRPPACGNGVDDDGDGLVDRLDGQCSELGDADEAQ